VSLSVRLTFSAQIYSVNGAMRGILAPAGVHSIAMRYRPMVVYEGAALTFLGILGAALLRAVSGYNHP